MPDNRIPSTLTGQFDPNTFVKMFEEVIGDELKARVPDLIEDTLNNPNGTYFTTISMIGRSIAIIDKTTTSIKEDTTYIRKLISKIEKKNNVEPYYRPSSPGPRWPRLDEYLLKFGIGLSIFDGVFAGINEKEKSLAEGKSAEVAEARGLALVAGALTGAGLGSSFGPYGMIAGAILGGIGGEKLDLAGYAEKKISNDALRAKAATGTINDKLIWYNWLRTERQRDGGIAWTPRLETELIEVQRSIQESASRVKDDIAPVKKPAPVFGEFNLGVMYDDWMYPRPTTPVSPPGEELSPTTNEGPVSASDMAPAGVTPVSLRTNLVADINDSNSIDDGQLVKVLSQKASGLYSVRQLTGINRDKQFTTNKLKLRNFRVLTTAELNAELMKANREGDTLSGSSSGKDSLMGSSGNDSLLERASGATSGMDGGGANSPSISINRFSRLLGGDPNAPGGSYGGGSGYHTPGSGNLMRRPGGSGSGGGSSGSGVGGVTPSTKKELRYDPLTGQLMDPGGSGSIQGNGDNSVGSMMAYAMDQLRKEGVPEDKLKAAAALLVGQAQAESGLDPTQVHDSGTGYGIYGARLDRRDKMLSWLESNGYDKNSPEGQMRYMAIEAMTVSDYAPSREALMNANANNMMQGTSILTNNFERPSIDNSPVRNGHAMDAFNTKIPTGKSYTDNNFGKGLGITYDTKNEPGSTTDKHSEIDHEGVFAGGVDERQKELAGIRKGDLDEGFSDKALYTTSMVSENFGKRIKFEVYSGGQRMEGAPGHKGTHQHDDGMAGDGKFAIYDENGKKRYLSMNNKDDIPILKELIRVGASVGIHSQGMNAGYLGLEGMHWGSNQAVASALMYEGTQWMKDAHAEGWAEYQSRKKSDSLINISAWKQEQENLYITRKEEERVANEKAAAALIPLTPKRPNSEVVLPGPMPAPAPLPIPEAKSKDDNYQVLMSRLDKLEKERPATKSGSGSGSYGGKPSDMIPTNTKSLHTNQKAFTYGTEVNPQLEQVASA